MQHFRRKMLIWKDADSGWWASGGHSPNVLPPPIGCYWDDCFPKIYALYLEKENAQIKLQQQRDVGGDGGGLYIYARTFEVVLCVGYKFLVLREKEGGVRDLCLLVS